MPSNSVSPSRNGGTIVSALLITLRCHGNSTTGYTKVHSDRGLRRTCQRASTHPCLLRAQRFLALAGSQSNLVSLAKQGLLRRTRGGGGKTRVFQGNFHTIRSVRRACLFLLQTSRRCWRASGPICHDLLSQVAHSSRSCKEKCPSLMTFMSVYLDFKANKEPCSDDLCHQELPLKPLLL